MKYMTFNSSCPYAGLANMLSFYDVDTDDRTIALEMGLPYYFSWEDGMYLAGPSLQTARWFNLYTNPLGFELNEQSIAADLVPDFLREQKCAMLGVHVEGSGKHAVIFTGIDDNKLCFLNNKWAHEPAPETFALTKEELLQRIDSPCMVATLRSIDPTAAPKLQRMSQSLTTLSTYRQDLLAVCTAFRPTAELRGMLNSMFRALLLDGITMLDLLDEQTLRSKLTTVQRAFLTALRSDAPQLRLADHIPMDLLTEAIDAYAKLIHSAIMEQRSGA